MKGKGLVLIGGIFIALLLSAPSSEAQEIEWKLKVAVEGAPIRLQPDPTSPALSTVAKGTILKSYEKEGDWFRIIPAPDKDGVVSIGYISSADVVVLEEKTRPEPDFWSNAPAAFRGIRLTVKITGGYNSRFESGLERAVIGFLDRGTAYAVSKGNNLYGRTTAAYLEGYDLGIDIIYRFDARLGLGLGLDYSGLTGKSLQVCGRNEYQMFSITSIPSVNAYAVRLGPHYEIPLSRLFKIALEGGPSFTFLNYKYSYGLPVYGDTQEYLIKVKGRNLGAWGGIGLELALNDRAGFFLEARGRYAKIGDLKGREQFITVMNYQRLTSEAEGVLYLVEGETYPRLAVFEDDSSAELAARKAVFDLSGVSLLVGLKFKI